MFQQKSLTTKVNEAEKPRISCCIHYPGPLSAAACFLHATVKADNDLELLNKQLKPESQWRLINFFNSTSCLEQTCMSSERVCSVCLTKPLRISLTVWSLWVSEKTQMCNEHTKGLTTEVNTHQHVEGKILTMNGSWKAPQMLKWNIHRPNTCL